jgi:MFS family permease
VADSETEGARQGSRFTQPGATLAPFRYPAFRAIWIANLASNVGSMVQSVAAAWLMTELTTSHQLIAAVQASATIPIFLFGVVAGAIADNYDRRRVMLAAQIGMLVVSALLAIISALGYVTPFVLLILTMAVGIGAALNSPAWQASVRQQVGLGDLPQAISLNTISFNLARSVGPALGGLLISLWDTSLAFALNTASYIIMIVVLLRWKPEARVIARESMISAIGRGLKFCAGSSPLRRVLVRAFAFGFGVSGYQALIPAAVRDRLRGGEIDFGLILGLFGVGSIIAALFVSKARRRFGVEALLAGATLSFVVAQSVLAEASSVYQALPAAFVAGCGWVMALTTLNVSMQMRSPENILGRCLSIYQASVFGGLALGAWVWGALADWYDLPLALHVASGFLLVSTLVLRGLAPMPKPQEGRVSA